MRSLLTVVELLTALVALSTAQTPFDPVFPISQYQTTEGGQLPVYLSAPILTRPQTPPFNGSIEVDVTAEDLPSDDTRQNAEFGFDYLTNPQNPSSRIFAVLFQSKQANSTEHVIQIAEDNIFEDREYFRLRIVAVRFTGQAAVLFRAQDGLNNTFVDVNIPDNDIIHVNWTISQPINVTEGDRVEVRLSGEAFGVYANPIAVGVICTETIALDVEPAFHGRDFNLTAGTKLNFTDIYTPRSFSSDQIVIPIINDDIAEPCKSFICTLQEGGVVSIRSVEPNIVTIEICDDDELIVRWATDVYLFTESQIAATVELVTDSKFEASRVSIQGYPRQIPDGHPNLFATLVLPGPTFGGSAFNATIERAVNPQIFGGRVFGNAQVTQSGRTDVVNTINDFVFTPASKSAFENFTIVDDSVLEFDELFIAEFNYSPEISNNWNVRKGTPSTTFILIMDDDFVEVNFNEDSYTVAESDGQVSISIRIDGQFFVPVWAIVEISDGTATDPEDYSSATRYNVTFRQTAYTDGDDPAPSAVSSPIFINITDDDIFEGVEYFQARIVETSDGFRVRIGQDNVNVTITDKITVQFEQDMYMVRESEGLVDIRVVASRRTFFQYTFTVTSMDIIATNNFDYVYSTTTYSFGPTDDNEPIPSLVITIPIITDDDNELDENFKLTIEVSDQANVTEGVISMTVVLIKDDDNVTVTFSPQSYTVGEGGLAEVMIVLDKLSVRNINISVTTMDITAQSPDDYGGGSFDVLIPAGSAKATLPVITNEDNIVEEDEYFNATLSLPGAPVGAVVGTPDTACVTITDTTVLIPVQFNPANYSVKEGVDSNAVIFLEALADHPDFDFTVTVRTQDGTAIRGSDYEGDSFSVTLPAGVNVISFNVTIIDDNIAECAKLFTLDLEIPDAAAAMGVIKGSPDSATVHIMDDDVEDLFISIESADYLAKEDVGSFVAAVNASRAADFPYTVTVDTADGSAVGGADFVSQQFQLDFAAGQTRATFTINIQDDNVIETMEYFQLLLSIPDDLISKGVQVGPNAASNVTIMDNDVGPNITVTAPAYIIQGDSLTVNCSVMSFPQSNVSLSLDDTPIVTSVSEAHDSVLGLFSYFTSYSTMAMHPSDEGNYTCSATITHGQPAVTEVYSEAVFVAVYAHPFIWDHPVDQTVNQSSQATFSCTAQGNPEPTISWTGPSDNFTTEDTFGTNFTVLSVLTIDSAVRALHEGVYTCSASNGVGPPSSSSATLTVQVPPTVQPVLGRVVGLELMHVTLAFVILDASPAVQAQSVHWTYSSVHGTSVSIPSDSLTATFSNLTGMFSDDRLILTLSGLSNDFEGTYTMTAINEAGSTSATIQLLIEGSPRIIKPPEDLQVVNGVIVTYDCFALAEPLHSLTWYFTSANGSNVTIASINGTEEMIAHSGKYQITDNSTSPDEYGRLLVRDVQFEDRGTYMCLAENRHGLETASATLAVQVPPMFLSTSSQVDITINSNDAITLKCSLRGYPLSALHWRKGDTPLAPDGSHINIITFRRQSPMDTYPFSSTLDSSFQPIPLDGLVYFEAVSELTLVPPIVKTDTANYTCVVEADFVHSYAETSDSIPVNISESTIIQLHLSPVSDCLTWVETRSDAKLSEISAALSVTLQQQCSCFLSVQQSLFSCLGTTEPQTVVFLAELSYTALPGVDMPSLLTLWVISTPHITVASTQLQVDTTCPVVIDSLQPESCPVASTAPPTGLPTDVTVIAVAVCVIVLLVMTVIVAIVIAVIVCCRKQSKYRPNHSLPNLVYECEYMNKEPGDVAQDTMTKNPSYVTGKEVISTSFASGTEEAKEVDYIYEVLPCEASVEGQEGPTHGGLGGAVDCGQGDAVDCGQGDTADYVHVYAN